jgi:uncharacterized protein (TIGR00369 family)
MAEPDYTSPELLHRERQEILRFSNSFPFFKTMGMQLLEIDPGRAKISIAWRHDLCQPAGILHGGAIASLVDTTIAHAILLTPQALASKNQGGRLVSVDLRVKYLRPVSEGLVYCEGKVTRHGRQVIHTSAVVVDPAGKEIAIGDSIYMMVNVDQLRRKES